MSFTCVYQYLSHLAGITVKLQKRSLDIIDAHELIAEVTATYVGERNDVDISFNHMHLPAKCPNCYKSVSIAPEMPRVTGRQQHCMQSFIVFSGGLFQEDCGHPSPRSYNYINERSILCRSYCGIIPAVSCTICVLFKRS